MRIQIVFFILFGIFLSSCGDSSSGPETNFDRATLLQNVADNLIIPRLENLQNKVNSLDQAVEAFALDRSAQNLGTMQNAWEAAILAWQEVSVFGFGPGELSLGPLDQSLSTFPVDESGIESAIQAQNFSLDNFQRDVRGFYAVEYLIFDLENGDQGVLSSFEGSTGSDRQSYLSALSSYLKDNVDQVNRDWTSFRTEFVNNDGTAAGSSISQLFNALNQNYESLKNFKVGLPAGKRPGQNQSEPNKVAALYSGYSRAILEPQFEALVELWEGQSTSGNAGIGFKDYLQSVVGGEALVSSTEAQIALVRQAFNNLPDQPLPILIQNNFEEVDALHTELQKLTRFIKSEMSSLLGIAITFESGDGD